MNEKDIKELLDSLTSHVMEIDHVTRQKQELIDSVMTDEIKEKLHELDEEFTPILERLEGRKAILETEIRNRVTDLQKSVKNDNFIAVYNKGRISWDTKFLEGVLALHPELEPARKQGKPSVSIRRAK